MQHFEALRTRTGFAIPLIFGFILVALRKSIQIEFAHVGGQEGLLFQFAAIVYKGC